MKLNFTKNENSDAQVSVLDGNTTKVFSYTDLIKSLLNKESVTCDFSADYTEEEKQQVNDLINNIMELSQK
ncbi:hypothetical protein [Phocaeicola coprocola]|uniref:hypothetical protein n=1 Tax=Phocaeicola coprocola TaxID=310298 RepID=UPI002672A457|nr:hypothetical protein [Phocaeicola coprocola]